jgi:hypothetical protein
MTGWEIVEGTNVEAAMERQFANVEAEYLHIHFAAPGCYAARDHLVRHKLRGFIRAIPLSEGPQSPASRLFARPE